MRILLASVVIMSSFAVAATTNPQDCMKQKKALDRRYCLDSYLETVKETHDAEKQTLAAGVPETTKAARAAAIEQDIAAKKDYMNLMKTEIEMNEKLLQDVKNAKIAATAAPVAAPPKKKKKKKGFRIKL
jgi:hypothetical protein